MLDRHAIARFVARQRRLLSDTYDRAWQDGQDNFADENPDDDPLAGDTGAVALLPRRKTLTVNPERKAAALLLASRSLDKVQHELAALTPGEADLAAADDAIAAGELAPAARTAYATAQALASWIPANMSRFDAGESVAWAGEQAGYAQAAGDDNELLEWITESDTHVCEDCSALGDMPPMPAQDWPTAPGEGATECSVGCRCALEVAGVQETRPLNSTEQGALDAIAAKASAELDRGFPDLEDFGPPPPGIVRTPKPPDRGPGGMEPGAPVRPADGAHARPGEQDVGASRADVERQRMQLWALLDAGRTVPEAAREMDISPRWAYRLRSRGRPGAEPPPPPPKKPDHQVIVERAQVMAQLPETLWRSDDPWYGFREYDASQYGRGHYYAESKGAARYWLKDPDGLDRHTEKPDTTLHEYRVPEGVNLLTIPEDQLPFTGDQLRESVIQAGYNGIRIIRTKTGPDQVVIYDKQLERVGPGPPKGKMDAKRDELFTWLDKGYSLKDAAANMGISATYASRLKKLGRRGAETREEPKPRMLPPKPGESRTMGEIRSMLAGMNDLDRADPAKLAKLGELINREAYDRERVLRSEATVERDRLRPLSNRAFRAYDEVKYDFDRQEEAKQLRQEYERLERELKAAWDKLNNVERESRLAVLSDLRDMGEKRGAKLKATIKGFAKLNRGNEMIRDDLEAVKRFFPTDWIRDSNANGGRTSGTKLSVVHETGRAFYRNWEGGAHVRAGQVSTLQHELGHRMEYAREQDRIRTAERNFYRYRTKGESARPLGAGYRSDEVARRDKFRDAYMGKDYDPAHRGDGRAYELLTMGSEAMWWKAYWGMDDEMTNWLLGLYAAA